VSDLDTPTGKRVVAALAAGHEVPDNDILAIEREAAAAERERLLPRLRDPERCHCGHSNATCDRDDGEWLRSTDIDTIRERHRKPAYGDGPLFTWEEMGVLLDALDAAIDMQLRAVRYAQESEAAARADADRLAEALEDANAEIGGCTPTDGGTDGIWCANHHDYRWVDGSCELAVNISEALRLHEEEPPLPR